LNHWPQFYAAVREKSATIFFRPAVTPVRGAYDINNTTVDPSKVEITPEKLLALPDAVNYELVNGQLVERKTGFESSEIAARIIILLGTFLRGKHLGKLAGADGSYQCFPDKPRKVRTPDVSFIRAGRLADGLSPQGHCPIPPDLAVEVISPKDLADDIDEKIVEYLRVGVPLIWIVSPTARNVRVLRSASQGGGVILTAADTIAGEDINPGFSCTVSEFFTEL